MRFALVAVVAAGCGSHRADPGPTTSPVCAAGTAQGPRPGPSPIRRLTHVEYDNTIRDLLGDQSRPSSAFPPDEKLSLFSNDTAAQSVTRLLAEGYQNAAEAASARATADLTGLLPCAPDAADDACIRAFIDGFGQRAWRRPLDDDDRADLRAAFDAGQAEGGTRTAVATVIEVALQSPEYLYRVEGAGAGSAAPAIAPVAPYEMAARLSYLFWRTMPDTALFDAAARGDLATKDGVRAQAERLLGDPRTRLTFASFFEEFLELGELDNLEKDPSIYPKFEPAIRTAFHGETLSFLDSIVWDGDGRLATLLTAPYTFVNGKLAAFYGMAPVDGTTFRRVDVDPARLGGLLTQGAFLATRAKFDQTSPIHRGKFVRERLFCTTPSPPPPDVAIRAPALDPNLTTRERFAQHATDPNCAGCHRLMDPIGLGFENFDGVGLWRDTEAFQPVDGSGELTGTDVDGTFNGARALEQRLARSAQVERCAASQWFRFAHGRADTSDDVCSLDQLGRDFHASGGDLRKLLVAITQTDAFRYRTQEPQP